MAKELGIEQHYEYLPIILLYRTIGSNKKIGGTITNVTKLINKELFINILFKEERL